MGIKFKYIDYGANFYKEYWKEEDRSEKNLYIFLDNRMRDIFSKRMLGKLFIKTPTLVTLEDFKEKVFLSDRIILKEAKRILAFFKSLPKEVKEELDINSYYDIIDLANNFFAYYRELLINGVTQPEEYPSWQQKYIETFTKIKDSFDKLCEEYHYLPSDWLEEVKNFDSSWLDKFSKIIFVDILEFPRNYVEIMKKLSETKEIEIALQMKKGDFDEENFQLKKVTLPEKIKNIEVYLFNSELEEALSLLYLKNIEKGEIYSPAVEKNNLYKILPNYFGRSQNFTMNDTKLYKFLNIQMNILGSEEEKLGKTYQFSEFLKAFEESIFKKYYNLSEEDFVQVNNCVGEGYRYISKKILEDEWFEKNLSLELLDKLKEIIFDLERINLISNTDELYEYFKEQIKMEKFIEEDLDNKDIYDKFFEIFGIIKNNEVMKIHKDFKEYFGQKLGVSLYKLLIQYMKDLAIKNNIKSEQDITLVKPIDYVRYSEETQYKRNYFIDITDEYLPKNLSDNIVLTEKQRKELGLTTREEKREIERYRFFQAIFTNRESIIFTQKNEEKGIEISPFLEEIILKYSLEIKDIPIENSSCIEILKDSFVGEEIGHSESLDEIFPKDISDFPNKKLQIGAYDYEKLIECPLKFFFMNMMKLSYREKIRSEDISSRILGIIVHNVLEEFVNSIWKKVLQDGIIEVEYKDIENRMIKAFKKERAKIPLHMDNYCFDIMIPIMSKNIVRFFKELKDTYNGIKIKRFQSEKSSFEKNPFYSEELDIYLKGRADLIIESELGNEIIDYKTGSSQKNQLDYYTIILYGEEGKARKKVFNVWKGKSESEGNITLTREKLEESLKEFVRENIYKRTEIKKLCSECNYYNICKRGKINEQ
ncbi:PD-(D/E)XK nuclease family protein [uncultured Fusobacterium sp.]|uniref:PD-(D/E)XK nuclease family protein n=1 Tax=uncultured Fusobacterium sp. TaxID=159267 RepID=UPI0025F11D02|nr:PD-(D/E)XK nuclease family protein [uncultured Fusobacterium sp.]